MACKTVKVVGVGRDCRCIFTGTGPMPDAGVYSLIPGAVDAPADSRSSHALLSAELVRLRKSNADLLAALKLAVASAGMEAQWLGQAMTAIAAAESVK